MSEAKTQAQSDAQAGSSGEAAGVGSAVGGVRSSGEHNWLDLWAMNPETRAYLRTARRDAACSHASSRREGAGDGPQGITTPEKLRHLQDTLYRKAKAEPGYRFWSLYGELTRRDLLEQALRLVVRNGGAPGVDGESLTHITATPQTQACWLDTLQKEMKAKTYRPAPVRRVYLPKSNGGQRPLGIPTVKDRVVQMAALLVLGPIYEADFHPCSYGFRPGRNAHQALDEIVDALRMHGAAAQAVDIAVKRSGIGAEQGDHHSLQIALGALAHAPRDAAQGGSGTDFDMGGLAQGNRARRLHRPCRRLRLGRGDRRGSGRRRKRSYGRDVRGRCAGGGGGRRANDGLHDGVSRHS